MKRAVCLGAVIVILNINTWAQSLPMINDDPPVNKKFDSEMFNFITQILSTGKIAPNLLCTLQTRNRQEVLKFSNSTKWTETLELKFSSNGFESGYKMQFAIPFTAKYGTKVTHNQWSGLGEEIKIELDDAYDHWIKFTHDGKGQIVQLILGNRFRTAPCELRR